MKFCVHLPTTTQSHSIFSSTSSLTSMELRRESRNGLALQCRKLQKKKSQSLWQAIISSHLHQKKTLQWYNRTQQERQSISAMFLKKREIMKVLCTGAYHNNLKIESLYEPSEYSDGGFPEEIYAIYNWSEPYPWTIHKENIEKFVSLCKAHGI